MMWTERDVIAVKKEEKLYIHKLSDSKELQGVFAYKLDVCFAGKVLSSYEGITTNDVITNFVNTGVFKNTFGYELVVLELLEKSLMNQKERSIPDECYILDPYTQNIQFEKNKYALIKDRIGLDGTINDFLGIYHSVGVHMDYLTGNISESHFDLEELLEILKKRDDIVFIKGAKIENIPYYNAEEGRSKTINFIWYPKEEDYNKCLNENGYFKAGNAPTKVFGLVEKEQNY